MPYCSKCGVEVDNHIEKCPLCDVTIHKYTDEITTGDYPEKYSERTLTNRDIRFITWHILNATFAVSFIFFLIVDIVMNNRITWSGYVMSGIGAATIIATFIILFLTKPLVIIIGNCSAALLCLFFLDLSSGKLVWFFQLGLPIWAMATVIIIVTYILIRALKRPGANVGGITVIMSAFMIMGIEMLVSAYFSSFQIKWSIPVMAMLIPLGVIMIVYFYTIGKKYGVSKYFHL